jgi:glycine/D-amino acid oxidase-like deaminating enzyme
MRFPAVASSLVSTIGLVGTDRAADVVIIGGGIIGCAAAYYLARRGLAPLVLERRHVAAHQSGQSFGFIRQQGRDPIELPLAMESARLWQDLAAELGADVGWVRSGIVTLAATPDRMAALERWHALARPHGLDTRLLRSRDLAALIPSLRGTWAGAMHTPGDGHADPTAATEAFARAAAARGATIRAGCAARSILTANGRVAGVLTDAGEIRTSRVVCAAGAWSARVVRSLGLRLPLRLMRSTIARTTPAPPLAGPGVWAPGVAFWQHTDGRLNLAGGSAADHDLATDSFQHLRSFLHTYRRNRTLVRFRIGRRLWRDIARLWPAPAGRRDNRLYERDVDPPPNPTRVRQALETLRRLLPDAAGLAIERSWAGYIDVTPDALPLLGPVAAPEGLIIATGCGRGLATAPASGRLIAELLVDGRASLDIHAFRPSRFADGIVEPPRSVL